MLYWIYGGALVVGSNTYEEYGPNIWMDRDIILVAVNYRQPSHLLLVQRGFVFIGWILIIQYS